MTNNKHNGIIDITLTSLSRKEEKIGIQNELMKNYQGKKDQVKAKSAKNKCIHPVVTALRPIPVTTLKKEGFFLPYLKYLKLQERAKRKERLEVGLCENYKIAYAKLRKRLHVDEPVVNFQTITDYDKTFFTCVNSSSTRQYVAPYNSLKYLYNSQLRWRQEVGYRHDTILNIERNFKKEQEVYDATVQRYQKQVKCLDAFISDDYKKSMSFLNQWENVKKAVNEKTSELQYLASEIFTMTSKILGLDYKYGVQQKYGRFLLYLSPPSWRMRNRNFARSVEIEAKGFDFGISNEEDTFNVIFDNLKQECANGLVKPVLYFEHPDNLLKIFDDIEQQQLHNFTHVARIAPHASLLKKGIKLFKGIINQDSAYLISVIKEIEKIVQFSEEQRLQLEQSFYNILYGIFYDNVAATDLLKLQLHLELCYIELYSEKPINLGLKRTAKALEDFYMEFSQRLESVTSNDIKTAIKQSVTSERNKYRKAKIAAKELRQFERLEHSLLRAYAPLQAYRKSVFKSIPKRPKSKKVVSKLTLNTKKKVLSKSELEYLTLFTDWTEKEDATKYLMNFVLENEENSICN